jgi:hypothetical protein
LQESDWPEWDPEKTIQAKWLNLIFLLLRGENILVILQALSFSYPTLLDKFPAYENNNPFKFQE